MTQLNDKDSSLEKPRPTAINQQMQTDKFLTFDKLIPENICKILSERILDLKAKGEMEKCEQCPLSHWVYDDPLFAEVQKSLLDILVAKLGLNLLTSFSMVRYYPKGEELVRHRDREAAEFVLSVTIDFNGQQHWPLYLQKDQPEAICHELPLEVGDGVIFSGGDLYHWREPLENDWQIQAFFFFVDGDGPYKDHAGDMVNKYKERA